MLEHIRGFDHIALPCRIVRNEGGRPTKRVQAIRRQLLHVQVRCQSTAVAVVLKVEIQLAAIEEWTRINGAALIYLANERVTTTIAEFSSWLDACRHTDTLLVGLRISGRVIHHVGVAKLDDRGRPDIRATGCSP